MADSHEPLKFKKIIHYREFDIETPPHGAHVLTKSPFYYWQQSLLFRRKFFLENLILGKKMKMMIESVFGN